MTMGMAQSLVERQGFDGAHMAGVFARNFAAEPWRGYGAGPPQVFRRLAQGVPWERAARTLFDGSGSFGNGVAMRVAPAALVAFPDLQRVAWLARETGRITHAHPLGLAGAVLQASALALLVGGSWDGPLDAGAFVVEVRRAVAEPSFGERLALVEALAVNGSEEELRRQLGNGIAALNSVPTALCLFLRNPSDFAVVVTSSIRVGGDTDTIASMAGALAGAYAGEEAIPPSWRDRLEGAGELESLADGLLQLVGRDEAAQ